MFMMFEARGSSDETLDLLKLDVDRSFACRVIWDLTRMKPNVGDLLSVRLMLSAGQKNLNVLLERVETTKLLF